MTLLMKNDIKDEIRKQEIFNHVSIDDIEPILNTCTTLSIKKDETLIHAGQANHDLYLILEGRLRVHLVTDMIQPVATLVEGQSVGEVSIIDHQPASAHVIADTDTRLLKISEDKLWRLVETSHAIANNMLVILSQRLRYGNTVINKIKDLLREYEYNATVDPLTSLYNRRWLDNMLDRVMQRCKTNSQPLTVIMIDIDFFKQFNDNNGHLAGDSALRTVARTVLQSLRPEDLVTRYGGEELLALLPGLDLEAARNVAERLRSAIETMEIISADGTQLPTLTISAGIAEMQDDTSAITLIAMAPRGTPVLMGFTLVRSISL